MKLKIDLLMDGPIGRIPFLKVGVKDSAVMELLDLASVGDEFEAPLALTIPIFRTLPKNGAGRRP